MIEEHQTAQIAIFERAATNSQHEANMNILVALFFLLQPDLLRRASGATDHLTDH